MMSEMRQPTVRVSEQKSKSGMNMAVECKNKLDRERKRDGLKRKGKPISKFENKKKRGSKSRHIDVLLFTQYDQYVHSILCRYRSPVRSSYVYTCILIHDKSIETHNWKFLLPFSIFIQSK